jgi:hypothetical protein
MHKLSPDSPARKRGSSIHSGFNSLLDSRWRGNDEEETRVTFPNEVNRG